jgi:hypothetical protein
METTLGISLYSYLYLKLAKIHFSYYLLSFLFNKIREQEGRTGSAWKQSEVAQIMNTHVNKYKNDKIKIIKVIWQQEKKKRKNMLLEVPEDKAS